VTDFREALAAHRGDLLRHCYRMLGSFADAEDVVQDVLLNAWKSRASFAGDAPLGHWLMRIATNACLNALASRKRRLLPQMIREPSSGLAAIESLELAEWIGPAPEKLLETRESVALAFIALLQNLPPKQRAVLLLKDVVGWSAEEIASALDLTVSSVNSALHRARETVKMPSREATREPEPEVVRAYMRSWETHDVDGLVAMLRDDLVFAMPPHSTWFDSRAEFERFLRESKFKARWAAGFQLRETRANGEQAFAFYHQGRRSSIQVVDFRDGKVAQILAFIGEPYFRGFDVPETV
jgi:RNA polymerase sigma-70 factor (ECF subfamily)